MATTRQHKRRPVITASEIGEFVYCAKAWQLKRTGVEADSPALTEGAVFHTRHGAGVVQAARLQRLARLILLLALAGLIVLMLFWLAARSGK